MQLFPVYPIKIHSIPFIVHNNDVCLIGGGHVKAEVLTSTLRPFPECTKQQPPMVKDHSIT